MGKPSSAMGKDGVLVIDTGVSLETTWLGMESLVAMGLVRSIGISNYGIFLTRDRIAYGKIKPAVNQIELHPYFQSDSLVKFCQKHDICRVTAHTPLGGALANTELFGSVSCLDDPILRGLAQKYNRSVAQTVLRRGIQRNTSHPKTSKLEKLSENFRALEFELAEEDMEVIRTLDRNYRTNQPAKFWGIDVYE